jgi:hypothetical protein
LIPKKWRKKTARTRYSDNEKEEARESEIEEESGWERERIGERESDREK